MRDHRRWKAAPAAGLALVLAGSLALAIGPTPKCTRDTQACLDHLATAMKGRGWMGVDLQIDKATGGLSVQRVVAGGPAAQAGIQVGDVLVAANGVRYTPDPDEAQRRLFQQMKPGATFTYTVQRDGSEREVSVTLVEMPASNIAEEVGRHLLDQHAQGKPASGG